MPKPLTFDAADPLHLRFVASAARLRAFLFGLSPPDDDAWGDKAIVSLLASSPKCVVPLFTPALDASIETDNKVNVYI